jgi:alginate O-acetyltransferase complex protein AlgI
MVFSSTLFIYGFAPVFFALYFVAPAALRNPILLIGSLVFYATGAGKIVLVLIASIYLNHWIAIRICDKKRVHRTLLLAIGVSLNLVGLIYYKYVPFLWTSIGEVLGNVSAIEIAPAPIIPLPIGISFFTFQAISYLVDVYRNETRPACSYTEFATYHTLFAQLVAGPIVRYSEIEDELKSRRPKLAQLTQGAWRFCLGFGKKIILADNLGLITDQILKLPSTEWTWGLAWLGIVCYALQIYYDFAGYSDMAIGLGNLLGFEFPENFDQPYRAQSVTEFWRRWHMTLTRWFRDYVYIPLGGNRRGAVRTYANLAIVFCLCGLWHGAGFNFLIWGLYHGVLLVIERLEDHILGWKPNGGLGAALTLLLVIVGWVPFRIEDMSAACSYLAAMFGAGSSRPSFFSVSNFLAADTVVYLAIAVGFALIPTTRWRHLRTERCDLFIGQLVFGLVIFVLAALQLASNSFNPFIYFRF